MIVIADSSPVNYLVLIGHVEVLQQLYSRVVIPPSVFQELQRERTPERVREWTRQRPPWLQIQTATSGFDSALEKLGIGERDAIALAEQLKADALLMDDRDARREAGRRHIAVIGTLQILDTAAEHGLIDMPTALAELQKTNFRISGKLLRVYIDREAARRKNRTAVAGPPEATS